MFMIFHKHIERIISVNSQVNYVLDFDNDSPDDIKHWLFLESVRIEQDKQELAELKKQFEEEKKSFEKYKKEQNTLLQSNSKKLAREKELFDKQWKIIEKELRRIAKDNERIENEKAYLEREKINFRHLLNEKDKERRESNYKENMQNEKVVIDMDFFVGTTGLVSVRKRYKELLKIFHPDNLNGDNKVLQQINREYEEQKKRYAN